MVPYSEQCFKMNSDNFKSEDINFFRDLYAIMKKYNINRIYTAFLNNGKIIAAQQLLCAAITSTKIINNISTACIFIYKLKLRKLFNRYGVEAIKPTSFSLYQGITITNDCLCIRGVELVFKEGKVFHIENLYLNI